VSEIRETFIQAYADDMMVSNNESNLQILINRTKSFLDFANIKLNTNKCEVFRIRENNDDVNFNIDGMEKEDISKSFVKHLGAPMGSKKIYKTKFIEVEVQRVLEELDKVEFCGLALNQIIHVIRCYIYNKLYYIFANMNLSNYSLKIIDEKVRRIINRFVKGKTLPLSFVYASVRNGGLGVPCKKDEYAAYKVHHIANLMSTTDGQGILDGYLNMKRKVAQHLSIIDSLGKALNYLRIKWLDWVEFVEKRRKFEWTHNEKNNKARFRFRETTTGPIYDSNLKNIHRSLVNHARIGYDYENYSRFNTRGLIN
jgi:hypothetical protein